jgi:hypothetical protein
MDPEWISAAATGLASVVAIGALVYAGRQARWAREAAQATRDATIAAARVAESEFFLHIEELLASHSDVHVRLRTGGAWALSGLGPESSDEWARVEAYMGLFERMNRLIEAHDLSVDYIARFYGYRINNIWANDAIRHQKLEVETAAWQDFVDLSRRVAEAIPRRFPTLEHYLARPETDGYATSARTHLSAAPRSGTSNS